MKKVLIVFDGTNFSDSVLHFISELNELQPILATGVFLPQVDYANLWSYAAAASSSTGAALAIPLIEPEDAQLVIGNVHQFESRCRKNGISYRVHKDFTGFGIPEIKKESRFADLVLLDGAHFFEGLGLDQLTYLKDALHGLECPVIVVPEDSQLPKSIILAYDGSDDSVYAIKQFAYLFPEWADLPTILVHAGKDASDDFPEKDLIEEFASQHFPDLTLQKLDLNPKKFFNTWMSEQKDALLVSGSFGRSPLSQAFRKSFVLDVIREHQLPVFIAHR
ncbi:MAG: hypothetical protein ACXWB9_00515 [Flavisolibacter sp.]